jgi:two-component system, sporulation sensor kinase E
MGNGVAYNYYLIIISVILAIIYSYTALDLSWRHHVKRKFARIMWLISGALVLGIGIWTANLLSLLAFKSTIDISFQLDSIFIALFIAVLGTSITFLIISDEKPNILRILFGSVLFSVTLLTVHYSIAGKYNTEQFNPLIPFLLAGLTAFLSYLLLFYEKGPIYNYVRKKILSAVLIGIAISSTNYIGFMQLAKFEQTNTSTISEIPEQNSRIGISGPNEDSSPPMNSDATSGTKSQMSDNLLASSFVIFSSLTVMVLILLGVIVDRRFVVKTLELQESESRYNSLVTHNPDGVFILDLDGLITKINPSMATITGYNSEEAIGRTFKHIIDEDYSEATITAIENTQNGYPEHFETTILDKNGNHRILKVSTIPHIENNQIQGVIGIAKDITEEKKTQEYIRQSEKLSVIGELAAGVAHEIRNPLTSLKGFTQILNAKVTDEKDKQFVKIMLSELDRINFIVSEFMVLSKPQALQYQQKELQTIMKHVITLLDTQAILKNIQIISNIEEVPLFVNCEENQLKQVFVNLLKNSIEAMGSGSIYIRLCKDPQEKNVTVRIKDEGTGIPEDILQRLGQPFFTTKATGTGLGLMVSYRIIEHHNGSINIESNVNDGTTVEVTLPLV